jgi:predicted AlkP superfamily pyrophosphatase or phosphodiesterase
MPPKVILAVIDGLTPEALEAGLENGRTPALRLLAENGRYGRAVSTFPSLTPVCISSIATGGHPDVHHIPHLVWYHRAQRRIVEYGSSFGAIRAAGTIRSIRDTIIRMNSEHLAAGAVTVFESLEDAGLRAAAVNLTCYRGRFRHTPVLPGAPAAYGPSRFFYYNLFESSDTGAPLAVRHRAAGSIDTYAAAVGRWLVTRDDFDFLAYYLSDLDFASHTRGPDAVGEQLERADACLWTLVEAAGGPDEFLERYAVLLCSDHGQTRVERAVGLEERFAGLGGEVLVTASNRAGQVYRLPGCTIDARELARRLDGDDAVEVALFLEGGEAVARREGEELRFAPGAGGFRTSGDPAILDHPDGLARVWAALANPNAGELLVSPVEGVELTDLGGRHHAGGGSHGSLVRGDSEVPVLAVGIDADVRSIRDVAPAVLAHLGVEPPPYARPLARAV